MDELIQLIFKSYGLVGVILASPLVAVVFLWRHNQALQDKLQAANDKRVEDAQRITDKLMLMSSEHASLSKETNLALDRIGDVLTTQNAYDLARGGRR